jgi:hypothetical protein
MAPVTPWSMISETELCLFIIRVRSKYWRLWWTKIASEARLIRKGKVKEVVGKVTGNRKLEGEGKLISLTAKCRTPRAD